METPRLSLTHRCKRFGNANSPIFRITDDILDIDALCTRRDASLPAEQLHAPCPNRRSRARYEPRHMLSGWKADRLHCCPVTHCRSQAVHGHNEFSLFSSNQKEKQSISQRFSNFFQVGTTFISQNVLRTTLLLGLSNSLGLP